MEQKKSTKQRILEESLLLFAEKGFDGVPVREIAGAVGVRESALYKHYKNKQDIMDSIMLFMKERIHEAYKVNLVPETQTDEIAKGYEELGTKELCEMSWKLFLLYVKDPYVAAYRKMLMREQFNNEAARSQFWEMFVEGALERQSEVFQKLVDGGLFKKRDSKVIALHFYGPIFYLFARYDCKPELEEEIKRQLFEHVKAFGRENSVEDNA